MYLDVTGGLCTTAPGSTLGFQIGADVSFDVRKRDFEVHASTGLCANVTHVDHLGQSVKLVFISSWTIIGELPDALGITSEYLAQFVNYFSYEVIGNTLVELKCFPTVAYPCTVSTIVFGIGDVCFVEFNVGDRKRDLDANNHISGGSLLNPNPFFDTPEM